MEMHNDMVLNVLLDFYKKIYFLVHYWLWLYTETALCVFVLQRSSWPSAATALAPPLMAEVGHAWRSNKATKRKTLRMGF